jgi:hypothetical protein
MEREASVKLMVGLLQNYEIQDNSASPRQAGA